MSPKNKRKKKKSWVKRMIKWFVITFFTLLIALILIPIFFKDQLVQLAIKEANKVLKADIALEDFDLTFISTFPNMTLSLEELSITGREEFDGVKLVDIKRFDAHVGFWSVISGSDIEISSIHLEEPKFDVRILENGVANYDIVKSEEEMKEEYPEEDIDDAPFKLSLNHYDIQNGYIRYDDKLYNMYAEMVNLNHEGNGDLTADVIDFETLTNMDALTYTMGGVSYFSETELDLVMNILMEFREGSDKYTLKENSLRLNALQLSFDGYYEMLDGYDDMDIVLKADRTSFKDLLSLVPLFYHTGYESMIAKGNMELFGFVKGRLDEKNMPAFDFGTRVGNASINYPDAPASIDNVKLVANAAFPGGADLDLLTINVDDFHADFVGNTVDANLYMSTPMSDPFLKSKLISNIDLSKIDQVIPLEEGEKYNGILKSDLFIEGKMSDLEKENYEDFTAEGTLRLSEFHYESVDLPDGVDINEMLFTFSPQKLHLDNMDGKMGKSDFAMHGAVENYFGYMLRDEELKGNFNFMSKVFDLNAFMPETESTETDKVEDETEVVKKDVEEATEPLLIPSNIDFEFNTLISDLIYDELDVKNLKGRVIIRNEEVTMENLSMNTMGGFVGLSGVYNTTSHKKPKVNFTYNLEEISIQSLVKHFPSIQKMAPISKHAVGNISSKFRMDGEVTPSFEPVYNSLNGGGGLSTKSVQISGYKPIEKLSQVIEMDQLKESTFRNLSMKFSFEDGKVHVQPFTVNMGKIKTEIEGNTSFEQEINYKMKMHIPKSEIPASIIELAEKGVAAAQNIPGFKMKELPDIIPVNALLTNTVTDPKVETDMREQLMALGGDVKGAVKDLVDETVQKAKDTVKAVVDEKVEDVKDDLRERRQKILDDAQKKADRVKAEGENLAERTRKEGDEQAQKLIDEASGPLEKRAAQAAADRIRKQSEEKAQKIEKEAAERADQIMREARERSDKLE